MAVCLPKKKSFGARLIAYLQSNPEEYDVTFIVGPKKIEVRALRVALVASSPVFEDKFKKEWDSTLARNEGGIPLPDTDPKAFAIFIKLLVSDEYTNDDLTAMKIPTSTILNVISLCQQYKELDMENAVASTFFEDFESFVRSTEFLKLSVESLELILTSDHISLDEVSIFKNACKWAEAQCVNNGLKATGENLRLLLGNALFQIRFPLMSHTNFANEVCTLDILSETEEHKVLKYISLNEKNRAAYDFSKLEFKTQVRDPYKLDCDPQRTSVSKGKAPTLDSSLSLALLRKFTLSNNHDGYCDGTTFDFIELQVSHPISINTIGFLGPVDCDGMYEVEIQLCLKKHDGSEDILNTTNARVQAKQRKVFYVSLETDFVLDHTWDNYFFWYPTNPYYRLYFKLKGSTTQTFDIPTGAGTDFREEIGGVRLLCCPFTRQLAELRFKRI